MITEEMLCAAAARSCEIYVSYLERGYTPGSRQDLCANLFAGSG